MSGCNIISLRDGPLALSSRVVVLNSQALRTCLLSTNAVDVPSPKQYCSQTFVYCGLIYNTSFLHRLAFVTFIHVQCLISLDHNILKPEVRSAGEISEAVAEFNIVRFIALLVYPT